MLNRPWLALIAAILIGHPPPVARPAHAIEFLNSGEVLPPDLPFSEAVRVGRTVYLSGQIGNLPGRMELADGGIKAEAKRTMENIRISLQAHGLSLADIAKCTVVMADMREWPAFNEVYRTFFEAGSYPARTAFGAHGLALDARVEVECIAIARE